MKMKKRIISLILCMVIVLSNFTICIANDKDVLKVAFYELAGFFEYDSNNSETGYGVELLDKISSYTNVRFEYVKADTWEETEEMLLNGEVDVRMPVTIPMKQSDDIEYIPQSILDTYYSIMTLKSNIEYKYEDVAAFRTMKIGMISDVYDIEAVRKYLEEIHIPDTSIIIYDRHDECRKAIKSGQIDAIICNVMDLESDMKILSKFNPVSNHIVLSKDNPYIEEIDNALEKIKLEDRTFFNEIKKYYFPDRFESTLSNEEEDLLEKIDKLTFAFTDNNGYFSDYVDGKFIGIEPEIAKYICAKLGLKYEEIELKKGHTENIRDREDYVLISNFFYDYKWSGKNGINISEPYETIYYYQIQNKNHKYDNSDTIIAAVDGYGYVEDYIKKRYDESNIVWFEDYESCINAVLKGDADITVINNYVAEYFLSTYKYSSLSASLIDYTSEACFGICNDEDGIMTSIINKILNTLPENTLEIIKIEASARKAEESILDVYFYQHPEVAVISIFIAAAIIVTFVILAITNAKRKKQNEIILKASNIKMEFMSRMSHDMRTPMNAVLGMTRLARDEEGVPKQVEYYLDKIETSGEYLLGLINDVLEMSKIETGNIKLREDVVDGVELLESIADMFRATAKNRGINFITDFQPLKTPWIVMDRLRTTQIYSNLINNAIKFSGEGSTVEWKLTNEIIDDENMIIVATIKDEGCGMSPEFLEKVFIPFEREHNKYSDEQPGTGLGLAIVKNLVEQMGGTIEVESELNKGTKFTITLKRKIRAEIPSEITDEIIDDDSIFEGKKVLVCEDQIINMEITKKLLLKKGMIVDGVSNGYEGTEKFKNSEQGYYDIILMDIMMPVMDGIEAAKTIRSLLRKDAKNIPIVAMTANAFEEDEDAARQAGMSGFVTKPIDVDDLYNTMKRLLKN